MLQASKNEESDAPSMLVASDVLESVEGEVEDLEEDVFGLCEMLQGAKSSSNSVASFSSKNMLGASKNEEIDAPSIEKVENRCLEHLQLQLQLQLQKQIQDQEKNTPKISTASEERLEASRKMPVPKLTTKPPIARKSQDYAVIENGAATIVPSPVPVSDDFSPHTSVCDYNGSVIETSLFDESVSAEVVTDLVAVLEIPKKTPSKKKDTTVFDPALLELTQDWIDFARNSHPHLVANETDWSAALAGAVAYLKKDVHYLKAVFEFIKRNEFWQKNCISPMSLKTKSKNNGLFKIDNIIAAMRMDKKTFVEQQNEQWAAEGIKPLF